MWTQSPTLWFSFKLWIYIDSDIPNLNPFSELALNSVLIDLENESPILDSHISLMRNEYEFKFFDLEPTIEPKSTLEPKLDFP